MYFPVVVATIPAGGLWASQNLAPLEVGTAGMLGVFGGAILTLAYLTSVSHSLERKKARVVDCPA